MEVIKRDGRKEVMKFDKITARIKKMTYGLNTDFVDIHEIARKVIAGVKDNMTTVELDNLIAEISASMTANHPDYSILAGRVCVSSLHKQTPKRFSECIESLYHYINPETQKHGPLVSEETYNIVQKHKNELDSAIIHDRDLEFEYFGFKTLERAYLLRTYNKPTETPQFMYMRVAIGIHGDNLIEILKTYEFLSQKYFTHATPTLFNAGTVRPQMSSCFLTSVDDSMKGIFDHMKQVALISGSAGGIGVALHDIRAKGSYIAGTNGHSNGLIPLLKVYNATALYSDQGGGKRKGSFAMYLEPWHADVEDFLEIRKNHGKEEMRARDLFTALWIPDLFMNKVEKDEDWYLMCPNECPGLADCHGEKFNKLYNSYIEEKKYRKVIKARDLWQRILTSQIESGTPYMLYKDACNEKSNQKNLGTIKSSNLCTEIIEYHDSNESAVCNLASIALPKYLIRQGKKLVVDYEQLYEITYQVTINLNKIIDRNFYPTVETEKSNSKHRPIGIGVQGLADVFALLKLPFISEEAKQINKNIFETIYFASLTASKDLAIVDGPYKTYKNSPISKGIFQFNMWDIKEEELSGLWKWNELREEISKHGVRNSLLVAPMPTASTSQILGNNECFEPFTSNLYTRRTLSGEFAMVNSYLVKDLIKLGLWNESMKLKIIKEKGSVLNIPEIPVDLKEIYKTVWEIPQKEIINMAADRGVFIDQSQSMNLFISDVNTAKLTSAHFYAWKKGLKTGMYYLRTQAAVSAIQGLGSDMSRIQETPKVEVKTEDTSEGITCSLDNPQDCLMCGS